MKTLVAGLALVLSFLSLYGEICLAMEQKAEAVQAENHKMLFLCYWELNQNIPAMKHVQIAKMLTESKLFPPEGIELIRFDKAAGDWGVTTFMADSSEAAFSIVDIWRVAGEGFFKTIKISPAMPVKEAAANAARLFKSVKEAEAKMQEK